MDEMGKKEEEEEYGKVRVDVRYKYLWGIYEWVWCDALHIYSVPTSSIGGQRNAL